MIGPRKIYFYFFPPDKLKRNDRGYFYTQISDRSQLLLEWRCKVGYVPVKPSDTVFPWRFAFPKYAFVCQAEDKVLLSLSFLFVFVLLRIRGM